MRFVKIFIVLFLSLLFLQVKADIKLPRILSSNMVLQRDTEFKIWGWADKSEKITVTFNGVTKTAKAGKDLRWSVSFPAIKVGGPYTMSIKGKNTITLEMKSNDMQLNEKPMTGNALNWFLEKVMHLGNDLANNQAEMFFNDHKKGAYI